MRRAPVTAAIGIEALDFANYCLRDVSHLTAVAAYTVAYLDMANETGE